ncbi:MAG: hypothetical protein H0T89_16035 [Deltaproteobacteria bacterium]|nr:hypothetical protein [Deltaproteobacteria bacterium]MDQ3300025.1 NapC/NirT family cytochrome c [Myxococcota bacterium]
MPRRAAARDPFYLAVFAEELVRAPAKRAAIERLCTRCHAPAGSEELAIEGQHLGFDDLTAGSSPAAILGRGGVTCSLCHQIDPANLGDERSFSGNFTVGYQRTIYRPYRDPTSDPMQLIVNFRPTFGAHMTSAELCATCHTVIVPGPYGDVVEQGTYLEWRASAFAADRTCQSCHVPTVDEAGRGITTPVAGFPAGLRPRSPVGRHTFVGANAYMLELMADAIDWVGAGIPAAELHSAARSLSHLAGAATLAVERIAGDAFTVRVDNLTGHKLPTGYPSRRMWLHVEVDVAGSTIFESGRVDDVGRLVDSAGQVLPLQPHRDEISAADEVQVWEARLVDGAGEPTHRAMDARRYGKDDRILPAGFAPSAIDRARIEPIAVIADSSFVGGSDTVTFRVPGLATGAIVRAALMYQTLAPETVDAIAATPTPAGVRFVELARAKKQAPIAIVRATATL